MRISAVMASFNAVETIQEAIRGVLAQQFEDFELIVVDDGSTDGTGALVEGTYRDPRVRVIKCQTNVGRAAARNIALNVAQGDLIAITDADDVSFPTRFAAHERIFRDKGIDVVSSAVIPFETNRESESTQRILPAIGADTIDRVIRRGRMPVIHPASMYRKEWALAMGGYDRNMLWAEDFEMILRGYSYGRVLGLEEPQAHYRFANRGPEWNYWRTNERWRRTAVTRAQGGTVELSSGARLTDAVRFAGDRARRHLRR